MSTRLRLRRVSTKKQQQNNTVKDVSNEVRQEVSKTQETEQQSSEKNEDYMIRITTDYNEMDFMSQSKLSRFEGGDRVMREAESKVKKLPEINEVRFNSRFQQALRKLFQMDDFFVSNTYRAGFIEFIASFIYSHLGQLAVVTIVGEAVDGKVDLLAIAISQATLLTFCIYCFGNSSGAHMNPNVTIAMWMLGVESFPRLISFLVFQLLGFITGSYATLTVLGFAGRDDLHTTSIGGFSMGEATTGQAVMMEFSGSLVLIMLCYWIGGDPNNSKVHGPIFGTIAVGVTLAMCIYYSGSLIPGCTGAGMNQWKALGPAIVTNDYDRIWIFLVIPVLAAVANTIIYRIAPPKFYELPKIESVTPTTNEVRSPKNSLIQINEDKTQ